MIKLTQTADTQYFKTENNYKIYLCSEGQMKYFGFSPKEIKVYTKNPKEKGAIKVEHGMFSTIGVKGYSIWMDSSVDNFILNEIKQKTFWVKAK